MKKKRGHYETHKEPRLPYYLLNDTVERRDRFKWKIWRDIDADEYGKLRDGGKKCVERSQ